jgi:hypothetical protein
MWQKVKVWANPHTAMRGEMPPKLWAICIGLCIIVAIIIWCTGGLKGF